MKRTIIATLICFLVAITLLPTAVVAETGNWSDHSGTTYTYADFSWASDVAGGTAAAPYKISTPAQLAGLAALVNNVPESGTPPVLTGINNSTATATDFSGKYIRLSADIDLSGHNWTPIGAGSDNPFKGTFDGNGKTVRNMTVDISSSDKSVCAGLFGYLRDGTVQNLAVSGSVTVETTDTLHVGVEVGGVVGSNSGGTVTNCSNTGAVTVNATADATADAKTGSTVGGVVGFNGKGTVTDCFNTGDVTTSGGDGAQVGGVVGINVGFTATSTVTNCYSTGDVTVSAAATARVGGVIGVNDGYSGIATVTNCYSTGDVTASTLVILPDVGGVAGSNFISGNSGATTAITNCYYLTGSASQGIAGGAGTATNVVGMPEAQMKAATGTKDGADWKEVAVDGKNKGKVALIDALNEYVKNDQSTLALVKWKQDDSLNSGYPVFEALLLKAMVTLEASAGITGFATSADGIDGSWTAYTDPVTVDCGSSLQIKAVLAEGYDFEKWATGITANPYTIASITEDITYSPSVTPKTYEVAFDANGGSLSETGKTVTFDATYGDLPTPTRFNHSFNGWFTAKDGGTEVTATTKVTTAAAHTLYAHWTEKAETPPFTDIKTSDWFYHHVVYMYNAGLMQGTDKTLFSPYNETSRGMLVAILYRLEGAPDVSGACPFNDVKAGSYYEKAIIWASANKIVYGYDKDTFGPNDDITREQLAMILFRYASYKGYDTTATADLSKFPDNKAIYSRALPAMTWAVGEGLLVGDQGNLVPKGKALRCETAAIIHRFCDLYVH